MKKLYTEQNVHLAQKTFSLGQQNFIAVWVNQLKLLSFHEEFDLRAVPSEIGGCIFGEELKYLGILHFSNQKTLYLVASVFFTGWPRRETFSRVSRGVLEPYQTSKMERFGNSFHKMLHPNCLTNTPPPVPYFILPVNYLLHSRMISSLRWRVYFFHDGGL